MRVIKALPSFERSLKGLPSSDQDKIKQTLLQFNEFLVSKIQPQGLGFKKIAKGLYEIRADIRLRIIITMDDKDVFLVVVGNHDDIKRYLAHYR